MSAARAEADRDGLPPAAVDDMASGGLGFCRSGAVGLRAGKQYKSLVRTEV